jgi:transcription factor SPT20
MAPVVATPIVPPKIKRPPPPGIQTNGVSSHQSSPSPSMSTKPKPQAAGKTQQQQTQQTPTSASANGVNVGANRPNMARTRREPSNVGRAQRNNGTIRSAGPTDATAAQFFEPRPEGMEAKCPSELSLYQLTQKCQWSPTNISLRSTTATLHL